MHSELHISLLPRCLIFLVLAHAHNEPQASEAARSTAVQRARELAIQDALSKLTPAVTTLGLRVGPFVSVEPSDYVSSYDNPPRASYSVAITDVARAEAEAPPSIPVSAGTTEVTSNLYLSLSVCS